jgi:Tfp pilus assembly PilM family ATPase
MARYLALEWDSCEARVAVARTGGREPQIEQVFTVPIAPREMEAAFSEIEIGEWIAKEIASRKLTGLDALVAIGRGNVELRMLTVPPAPDDELPDLVRFQAQSHFSALGDDWALDYLPVTGDENEQRHVLAAGISPEAIDQVRKACETAQLRPRKLLLRSCAAASLLKRHSSGSSAGIQLMVDLLAIEADLTVLMDGEAVFMRTVRLPGEKGSDETARALGGEIRRTMAAANSILGDRRVESVVLFGTSAMYAALCDALEHSVELPVQLCDPFEQVALPRKLKSECPDPGGFAPLLGALLDEVDEQPHAIDFLHPRKTAEPPSRRQLVVSIAAVAAIAILLLVGFFWWQIADLDGQIAVRKKQSAELNKVVEAAKARISEVDKIDAWARNEVIWLKQLAEISERLPGAEAVRVSRFGAVPQRVGGGEMDLDGFVDQHDTILQMESALRDAAHRVIGSGGEEDDLDPAYPWRFKERVLLEPIDPIDRPKSETPLPNPPHQGEGNERASPPQQEEGT